MGTTGSAQGGARERFVVTEAERRVADLLAIEVDPVLARATVETVPFWFHTFALNRAEGIYTPGAARDHRYRVSALPEDFAGMSVLDVGCFDGFYAFLAERRGAERVVAVDNEQYRLWVASRWGVELEGGEGFRAVHRLLGSAVEYRRMDAFALDGLEERFDLVYCFGILHRVENPLGLLRVLRGRTVNGGTVLVETYGVAPEDRNGPAIRVSEPGEVYARDDFVYWGFGDAGLERLARIAGFSRVESLTRRGGRRPPAAHGPAGRLDHSRTAFCTTSSQDGCRLVTRKRACVARVVGVLPALYAHRLGRAYGPDSSLAALHRAIQQPLDGLETDCCLTADGELVLLHDPLLDLGTTVSGWAHQRTAVEIRAGRLRNRDGTPSDERPLLLDELLDLAPPGATLQLEVKAHANPALARRTARAVCERLRDHPARERTEIISFWSGACELAAELGFRARLVIIADYRIHALAAWGRHVGLHGVCVEHFLLSRALVANLRACGLSVTTGTINHAAILAPLLPLGLDAITSDSPHELRQALSRILQTPPLAA